MTAIAAALAVSSSTRRMDSPDKVMCAATRVMTMMMTASAPDSLEGVIGADALHGGTGRG
ncbi:hypothetical protein [Streptomyces chartreusis]